MDDLVQFLRDRLDEDERIAKACAGNGQWDADDIAIYGKDLAPEVRAHMANHDPARVLAEIEAKRALVKRFAELVATGKEQGHILGGDVGEEYLYVVLPVIALPYASHPDYNETWRP